MKHYEADVIKASQIPAGDLFRRRIICVTGSMAAGKNAVADILNQRGFSCIDADKLVHQVLEKPEVQKRVLETFAEPAKEHGITLTHADGSLDRRALGTLLFADKELLAKQEAIIHPETDAHIATFVAEHPTDNIVLNAAVLYKTKAMTLCDTVFYIDAPFWTRLWRAKKRDHMPIMQILARFWQQRSLFAKYKNLNADVYKVSNTGSKKSLVAKIDVLLERLIS